MTAQYIYLLKEREFIKTDENIYKIGRTCQENDKRVRSYPKGSVLLIQSICKNCVEFEALLIKKFKETFIHRKDIGNEYFDGDGLKMLTIFLEFLKDDCFTMTKIQEEYVKDEKYIKDEEQIERFLDKTYELITNIQYKKLCRDAKNSYVQNIVDAYKLYSVDSVISKADFRTIIYSKADYIRTNKIRGFIGKLK
jgi:hypothetical protein